MYCDFNEMPDSSRLWVYQADRQLTATEKASLESSLVHLCQTWMAHGAPLKTSFRIEHNQFIILAVDESEAGASGCSIDGSVRLIKETQHRLGIDFFNRTLVPFLEGGRVIMHRADQLKTLFDQGVLQGESITFNPAVVTKGEWVRRWRLAVKDSWLSRYLPKAAGVRQA